MRIRKLIGAVVMLGFVFFYALLAVMLAESNPVRAAGAWFQWVVYVVLGLAWVLPLMPLIKWMERPGRA